MNTSSDTPSTARFPRKAASALVSLLAATWAAGCGEPAPAEAQHLREATSTIDPCPSGVCTGNSNGLGIFVAESSSYCIPGLLYPQTFCPEYFTHRSVEEGGTLRVALRGHKPNPRFPNDRDTLEFVAAGLFNGTPVEVTALALGVNGLIISVKAGVNEFDVTGADLSNLLLEFTSAEFNFTMRFIAQPPEHGVPLYRVEYSTGASWQSYCGNSLEPSAFLPRRRVNSLTARVEDGPLDVTLACRSGAIATCMAWGYRPHEATAEQQTQANYLFGSCLQAKRAAYFVQSGDFKSYTSTGTHIYLEDNAGIQNALMPGVEALWSPTGAVCFSEAYRRIQNSSSAPLPALPATIPVPECDVHLHNAAQQSLLQGFFTENAPLATGPAPY